MRGRDLRAVAVSAIDSWMEIVSARIQRWLPAKFCIHVLQELEIGRVVSETGNIRSFYYNWLTIQLPGHFIDRYCYCLVALLQLHLLA